MFFFFFFNDTATTEIYTLSLHDALPIYEHGQAAVGDAGENAEDLAHLLAPADDVLVARSEEHTSELQSRQYLVCRLLLEKKKSKMSDIRHKEEKGAVRTEHQNASCTRAE